MTVTKLALTQPQDEVLICAAAVFFNNLIDAEIDRIVDSRNFSRALVDLVRKAALTGEEIEIRLIELLFGVANKIRLQPTILPAWFHPKGIESPNKRQPVAGEKQFAGATRKDDFPLFYLLVDFVHHEGRPGDFARTGLLYIIETASRSRELEKWLIESDLATLMATGLGALYSQLNR
jgi:Retinoic acid induced 16-like protein